MKKRGNYFLYTYNITNLNNSNRVRFVYLLKGRKKNNGIISKLNGTFLAPGCFIIPTKEHHDIQKTFKEWNVKHEKKLIQIIK